MHAIDRLNKSRSRWVLDCADATLWLAGLPDRSVDLVFGSPPYADKGQRYGDSRIESRPCGQWARWMLGVTRQALRVCRGDVLWVVNSTVIDGAYAPAVESLICLAYDAGLTLERPCIWNKNSPPNRPDWYGNDWEYVIAFRQPGPRVVWQWEAIAEAPKYSTGGAFRQRGADGKRRTGGDYPTNAITRPRDVVRVTVGGGQMGHSLASQNEAPFPENLPAYFLPALCPDNGIVCDPFLGSGTTGAVALRNGFRFVGCDCRQSQLDLSARRLLDQFPESRA